MKKNVALLMLLAAIVMIPAALRAQKVGSTSMQFLENMPVARATALGDAYSVIATGADAVFWNPAGVASTEYQELSSTYTKWIFDTRQGALGYAMPLGTMGAVGVQIQYVDFGEFLEASAVRPYINKEVDPGLTGRTFHPFSYLVGVTYANKLTDRFSTGLSVKYAHESLYNGDMVTAQVSQGMNEEVKTWADGLMFDFGLRYNTGFHSVLIGASIQNFGGNVTYAKESSPVPLLFRWGIAADVIGADALLATSDSYRLGISFDLYQPNDYDQQEHVGLEYEYSGSFALRCGYKFNYDYQGLTVGGGIKQSVGPVKLSVDYSYGSMGTYLGSVHRISVGAGIQ